MKRTSKFGKLPINARITIDYSKKKPKIHFGYIAVKQQRSLNYINTISICFTFLTFFILLWLLTYMPNKSGAPLIGTCGLFEQHDYGSNTVSAYNISCPGGSYFLKYTVGKGIYPIGSKDGFYPITTSKLQDTSWIIDSSGKPWYLQILITLGTLFIAFGMMGLILIFIFGLSYFYGWLIQYIPFLNKKVNRWIPEINKKLTSVRYVVTFKKCPENKILEIPLFKNVFLDYDAKGDFSKYLKRVEIREHPFSMISKKQSFKFGGNRRHKQKYKKKKNVFLWKASFIFKEVPKRGQLEVRWA